MRKQIKKSYLFMVLFVIVFTKPTFVDVISGLSFLNVVYDLLRIVLMAIIPILYTVKYKFSEITVLITALYLSLIYSTWKNSGDLRTCILAAGMVLTCSMFADLSMKIDKESLIEAVESVLFFYIVLNLITVFIFPNGLYRSGNVNPENWILGNKNLFAMYHIPYLFVVYELKAIKGYKFRGHDVVGIAFTIISTLISGSSTGIVGVAVFFLVLYLKKILQKNVTAFLGVIVNSVLFVLIVLLNLAKLFEFVIVNILHKDLTLTVRTYVWEAAIKWYFSSPIYGVGLQNTDVAEYHMFRYYHPHCTYLYYLVFAGAVGLFLFGMVLIFTAKKIDKSEVEVSIPAAGMLWGIMIIYLTDVYSRPELFFICFVIAYNLGIDSLSNKHSNNGKPIIMKKR